MHPVFRFLLTNNEAQSIANMFPVNKTLSHALVRDPSPALVFDPASVPALVAALESAEFPQLAAAVSFHAETYKPE